MFDARGDLCLGFFDQVYDPTRLPLPSGAQVLEIGAAEADWQTPMLRDRPDLRLTGIDVRPAHRPGTTIQGDVLTHDFAAEQFDAVVAVSTVEHIGLGAYGDPVDPDGDIQTMRRVASWLRPGGWCYFDVPFRDDAYTVCGNYRAYDWTALGTRLLADSRLSLQSLQVFRGCSSDAPYVACVVRKHD